MTGPSASASADHADRLARVQKVLRERDLGALLVGPSADLRYLTGYEALPLERLTLLVIRPEGDTTLIVPALEEPAAAASGAGQSARIVTWTETENPMDLVAANVGDATGASIAVSDRLWASFLLRMQAAVPGATWLEGSTVMRELRITKTPAEVERLRAVGQAIDEVHRQVPGLLRPGRTEAEVGRDIGDLINAHHEKVNFVIVASGPNGASPHHHVSDRVLEVGDPVVVDIGGTLDDYCSDCTRNYSVGPAPQEYRELHEVLERSQAAGMAASVPGATAERIDAACRDLLVEAGYGEYFVHRTGHGIGVEEHEEPWIVSGNDETILAGMAFSVEPGIYIPGRYGARIEDIVVATGDGPDPLNVVEHALIEVEV